MAITTLISHLIAQKTLNYRVLLEEEKSCLQSFMVIIKPLETVLTSQLTIRGGKADLSHHLTFSFSHQLLSTTLTLTPEHIFLFLIFLEMATHSSILAWEITWREEPGRLQSMGLQKSQT